MALTTANMPPFINGDGERVADPEPGWLVEEARRAFARVGCALELVRLPQRRIELEMTQNALDFAIGLGDSEERTLLWRFPTLSDGRVSLRHAIGSSPVHWLVLRSRHADLEAAWRDGRLNARLGVIPQSIPAGLIRERGLQAKAIESPSKLLVLLERDRFDAIAIPLNAYAPQLQSTAGRFAVLKPALGQLNYFVPASRALFTAHPTLAWQVWEAMCEEARQRAVSPGCQR